MRYAARPAGHVPPAEREVKKLPILPDENHRQEREGGQIEEMAIKFASYGARTIVIRSGARGSYVLNSEPSLGAQEGRWVDAYWRPEEAAEKVKSTTGAGNSFLGGLCAGLALTGRDIFKG